jgi:hypothetical protein
MGGVEGRAERRMGGEIMRGGRNGEYNGRFWRGVMTGWSKEGRRENYVPLFPGGRLVQSYDGRGYAILECYTNVMFRGPRRKISRLAD